MFTDRFDDALAYASRIHRAQIRKGSEIPYVSHLLGVAALAIEAGADEDQAIAALLHDAAEDQGGSERLEDIRQRFGDRVAGIVSDCTDSWTNPKPDWGPRKEAYLASLGDKSEDSLLVSLADKMHNAGAINADLAAHGPSVWDRFTGGREGSLWYYGALAETFQVRLPGPTARRFDQLVDDMHTLAGAHRRDGADSAANADTENGEGASARMSASAASATAAATLEGSAAKAGSNTGRGAAASEAAKRVAEGVAKAGRAAWESDTGKNLAGVAAGGAAIGAALPLVSAAGSALLIGGAYVVWRKFRER